MTHKDATTRLRIVLASRSPAELTAALDDPSPEVARAAIGRLADVQGPGAADDLRARLLGADLSLVTDIATALRRIGDRRAVALTIAGLREESYTRRQAAARALGVLREAGAAGPLRAALRDEIAGVRIAALDALSVLGPDTGAARDCARLLSDPDPQVRIRAVRAVARTAPRPGRMLAAAAGDSDRIVRLEVARHEAGLPEQAASALLADPDLRVREAATRAAGIRQLDQLRVLVIEDPSSDVRRAAAGALGSLGDERIADVLVAALEDGDVIVRAAALRALERLLTSVGAARCLRNELQAARAQRRRAGLYALARLRARQRDRDLSRLARDPDADVRLALLQTADEVLEDPEPVVRYLTEDDDQAVRHAAEMWLLRHSRGEV